MLVKEPRRGGGPIAYLGEAIAVGQAAEIANHRPGPGPAGNPQGAHPVPRIVVGEHAAERPDRS